MKVINRIKESKVPLAIGALIVVIAFGIYVGVSATGGGNPNSCPSDITKAQCAWVNQYTTTVLQQHPEDTRSVVRQFWIKYIELAKANGVGQ